MTQTALVTDGEQRSALAVVRSLGRRGIGVIVGHDAPDSLAAASKYCVRRVVYPSPERHPESFERFLLEFVARERVDVVVPVTDVTTHALCRRQLAFEARTGLALPAFDAFEAVTDKWKLVERATRCGIPVPRTRLIEQPAEALEAAEAFTYPVVIKPVRSRILTQSGWSHATVHYAYSREELADLYEKVGYLASHPSLVQHRIVGPGAGVFVLFDRGRLRAAFAHRRLRERPPSGGTSVLRESIALDPVLRDHAVRLLAPLGWHGVAMLEFKQDVSTGRHFLMEVNGRFWGSLQLAIDAGVDFPFLLYELARRREIPEAPGYRVGTKSRWLLGDLDHLVARLLNSDRALCLAEGAPSRLSTLVNFLKFAEPGLRYEVASTGDPGPFWHELRQYGRSLATGAGERLSRRVERARVLAARLARTTIPL